MKFKALKIAEVVCEDSGELSLSDIHVRTNIPIATLTRLLPDLIATGYIQKTGHGRYKAGSRRVVVNGSKHVHFMGLSGNECRGPLIEGMRDIFAASGFRFSSEQGPSSTSFAELTREDALRVFERSGKSNGFIFFSNAIPGEQFINEFNRLGVTIVNIGLNHHMPYDTVVADFEAGGERMVDTFYRAGHRGIGFVAQRSLLSNFAFRERRRGYELGMAKYGLSLQSLFYDAHEAVNDTEFVTLWLRSAIEEEPRITAIIVSGHTMDRDIVKAALELGLEIPRDLSIMCFGKRTDAQKIFDERLAITTFDSLLEPWEELGRTAAARMISRLMMPEQPVVMIKVQQPRERGESIYRI